MTAYCKSGVALLLPGDQGAMSKSKIFLQKAAEFDELAARATSLGLRDSYAMVAQSYRRLVQFMENQKP
jgi:hypothetical protein